MTTASAPGKIILFGEHAVVYQRPAIAIPVRQIGVIAAVTDLDDTTGGELQILAPEIELDTWLHEIDPGHPLARIILLTLDEIGARDHPALGLQITSTIPIAAGLGSGAAVSVSVVRALSNHLGQPLPLQRQSELAFEVEKIHHGTPSGIDNTVVTFDRPIYYQQGHEMETFHIGAPFTLVIGDSGHPSPTADAVGQVRQAWVDDRSEYEALFDDIGQITSQARDMIDRGDLDSLGSLMDHNHKLLKRMGVSSNTLETLIYAAHESGARGAKLSGAGLGGNVIALVEPDAAESVELAMQQAGAVWTLRTEVT